MLENLEEKQSGDIVLLTKFEDLHPALPELNYTFGLSQLHELISAPAFFLLNEVSVRLPSLIRPKSLDEYIIFSLYRDFHRNEIKL